MVHDLVIRGGTIVDGTGNPAFVGDIAVDGNLITTIGTVHAAGREEIDATGRIVTPGFVDIHTHYDGQATWDPEMAPSSWHGVTTVVMGNCGVGFAPAKPDRHDWLIGLMEGVEDIPGTALAEGMTWNWETFPEYLDELEKMPRTVDIGTHVPHGAVRAYVLEDREQPGAVPTAEDIEKMGKIVEAALCFTNRLMVSWCPAPPRRRKNWSNLAGRWRAAGMAFSKWRLTSCANGMNLNGWAS
jgi:N-acyl-D-amino-acid deacylase